MKKFAIFFCVLPAFTLLSSNVLALELNHRPVVYPTELTVSFDTLILTHQVLATDADGDRLNYELVSPKNSLLYTNLSIDKETGIIDLKLNPNSKDDIYIEYVVTDGKAYSDKAKLKLSKVYELPKKGMGLKSINPVLYNSFRSSNYDGSKIKAALPSQVDLSAYFPMPSNQGSQGSCTAWAVGYAAKSYEEKIEMGWAYQNSTLFSPAWIYNQINGGSDEGSYIHEALDLLVKKGAATLATMPYNEYDYLSQPSAQASREAIKYKAASWTTVKSKDDIKDKLSRGLPVIIGIDIYENFNNLKGINSVYLPAGNYQGGHAVTLVGYNDNKYGGAYKAINSWSTSWGDKGYFWLPYSVAQTVYNGSYPLMNQAYTLYDAKNDDTPINNNLPNLSISNWSAAYDNAGNGKLSWRVTNTGQAIAPKGWDVSLLLSKDKFADTGDTVIAYETVNCCTMNPGTSLSRSSAQGNELGFSIPSNVPAGAYYMILQVDSANKISEFSETDNLSASNSSIVINASLPNLRTIKWQANFINSSTNSSNLGKGIINYQVINDGMKSIDRDFWVGLFLVNKYEESYLIYAKGYNGLSASYVINRYLPSSALPNNYDFNLNAGRDVFGYSIPNGEYKFRFVVDYPSWIVEANETDNVSDSLNYYNLPLINSSANKKTFKTRDGYIGLNRVLGGLGSFDEDNKSIFLVDSNKIIGQKDLIIKSKEIENLSFPKIIVGDSSVISPVIADFAMPKNTH